MDAYPPTVVVRHRKEYLPKCTLTPLHGRPDIRFVRWPDEPVPPKCSLMGSLEQMGPAGLDDSRKFW
ncbi:MAG: hypothetical protein D6759_08960, partial [Chloroflexi bacterium]